MSTGPEHYREAERLVGEARGGHEDAYADSPAVAHRLAEAQVHATLALVAALANTKAVAEHSLVPRPDHYGADNDALTWTDVIQ